MLAKAFAFQLLLAAASPVAETECPPSSREVGRTTIGDEIVIDCKCDAGFQLSGSGDACVSLSDARPAGADASVLTDRQIALATGAAAQGLIAAARIYGLKRLTDPARRMKFRLGLWQAGRGQYEAARRSLSADRLAPGDAVLEDLERALDELAEEELGALSVIFEDPALAQARGHMAIGDYQAAAAGWSKHPNIRRAIKAFAMTHQADPATIAKRRTEAAANAGLKLADHLVEHGQFAATVVALSESARIFSSLGLINESADALFMAALYAQAESDNSEGDAPEDEEKAGFSAGPLFAVGYDAEPTYFESASSADIILDALEYGAGNWQRSLSYLEIAQKVDPDNITIDLALAYVRAASMVPQ